MNNDRKAFGPNARPFLIQFVVGLILLYTIGPIVGRFVADTGCQITGWCGPQFAERTRASTPPQ